MQRNMCRAVEFDGMSSTMQANLAVLNTVLTWAFAAEVVLKVTLPSCTPVPLDAFVGV